MDGLFDLFSWFCGQPADRCFVIDGQMLPVCQRCLGVWCGVLFGALLAPGAFRREAVRPGPFGLALIGVAIAGMFVMGLHWIDPGPGSRFICGYCYGAALIWLALPVAKSWILDLPLRPASIRRTLGFLGLSLLSVAGLSLVGVFGFAGSYTVFLALTTLGVASAALVTVGLIVGRILLAARRLHKAPAERLPRP